METTMDTIKTDGAMENSLQMNGAASAVLLEHVLMFPDVLSVQELLILSPHHIEV